MPSPRCSHSRIVACKRTNLVTGDGLPRVAEFVIDCATGPAIPCLRRGSVVLQVSKIKSLSWFAAVTTALVICGNIGPARAQHMDVDRDVALAHEVLFSARLRQDPVMYATAARLLAPHVEEASVLMDWIKAELARFPSDQVPDLVVPTTPRKGIKGKSILRQAITVPARGEFKTTLEMEPDESGLAFIVLREPENTRHLEVLFSGDWGKAPCAADPIQPGGYRCTWRFWDDTKTIVTITNKAPFDIQAHLIVQ